MTSDASEIKKAAELLRQGKLVAFPTETVYGLGGNALMGDTIARIYDAKGRPQFNPLITHVASLEEAQRYGYFSGEALQLAKAFWPGPLTLIVPRNKGCTLSLLVSAGLDCIGLRVPAHTMAQTLLIEAGVPVAAPSANRSGRISPTEASHVAEELGDRVDMILDGGPCEVGIESTVVDMTGPAPVLLRPGSVMLDALRKVVPEVQPLSAQPEDFKSPGLLASHYAPSKPLRLNAKDVWAGEALLAFGRNLPAGPHIIENLSYSEDLQEAAANLFRMLRALDVTCARSIAVMPIPEKGLGVAINDRLKRAAAPK